ncbi:MULTISPECIES: molybdopterin-guanine dinucleotide biosynthesis protein MobB [unclassified Pantoea]|uniref:molybdopterin-guanine dinucleotide biosynthesis protein MobB n=1 Tax=unclassified Pantoea TaxID=2630326 RepID=UPI00247748FD|nr:MULTISPECIES: molybdopterin-guanine dinucleotide biosynthesis protein MobB [unclassified Pantoea]GME46637.1 molybdopterin-guanine dinucleotide biosynthesis protein MobB [Pantoea sp. QMID1]GME46729.1 molybdopterin-guanine dinucleotide biosynthesis protein MobB [Pantoea sp. QMID3]GME61845.1 molybdopterin-guanine dinucleotide biosynthesis protein MobB [Pantoea sp. QMID4]GME63265.1 molybdopterin-guanine dinucleotide biosynthesis protein MobB [Pantoea sp. QMID2]
MSLPLLAIVGWSGTGKTTLLQQVIPILNSKGIRTGLIKHTHHEMDVDTPGKDSYLLRKAGASQVMVASSERWALMCETPEKKSIDLPYLLSRMDHSVLEIVLVEGFKEESVPKIVLWRAGIKGGIEELLDELVIAIASDQKLALNVPVLDINRPDNVADFIADWLKKR